MILVNVQILMTQTCARIVMSYVKDAITSKALMALTFTNIYVSIVRITMLIGTL